MLLYERLRSLIIPLAEIDNNLPKEGKIYDLGCGQGVIAKYVARRKNRRVIGIDINGNRIPHTGLKNLSFSNADIRQVNLKQASGIILSDVLHHLNKSDQKKLLSKIFTDLKKEGILVIKEIDELEQLRSKLSRFWDFVLYPKDKISYWNSNDLINFLEKLGFKVKMLRSSRLFPGSTNLFIARK